MLRLILFISFLLFTTLQLKEVEGQANNNCPTPTPGQGYIPTCGPSINPTEQECRSNPTCCWNPSVTPPCYANIQVGAVQSRLQGARSGLTSRAVARPTSNAPLRMLSSRLGGIGLPQSNANGARIASRITGLGAIGAILGNSLFPECAVPTPFCQRTACNADDPSAESDPLRCLSDPSCCFDSDLFLYRAVFGPAFMNNAPICYYGPTAFRYRQLAEFLGNQYNPFFQNILVDLFREYFNTGLDFAQQAICAITTIGDGILADVCGWNTITELQCYLKGCCWNAGTSECFYPSRTPILGLPNQEFYPELIAQPGDEIGCSGAGSISPNIFRRLPCRRPRGNTNDDRISAFLFCPRDRCCQNPFGLVPELASLTLASSGGFGFNGISPNFNLLNNPLLLVTLGGSNFASLDFTQFYCPYLFFPLNLPGFPDLSSSTADCCLQYVCYHQKQGPPPTLPPPCNWTPFSSSGCNAPCGGSGTETLTRQCRNSQTNSLCSNSACPGSATEQRSCQRFNCGFWSNWRNWGGCSTTCGGNGIRSRSRSCINNQNGAPANGCPGSGTETGACLPQGPCFLCRFTEWSNFGPCSAGCGDFGFESRNRQCIDQNGLPCGSCVGSATDSRQCQGPPCCSWSNYGAYSPCNAPCGGGGSQTRTRFCRTITGQSCAGNCPGSGSETRVCQGPSCPCSWSEYGPFSACSAPCEGQGTRTRTRTCRTPSGLPCSTCPGSGTDSQICFGNPCFSWGAWQTWGTCTSACTRGRSRQCQDGNNQAADSQFCDGGSSDRVERGSCIGGTCLPTIPGPWISWGPWQPWSSCSAFCGSGRRFRERACYYRDGTNSPLPPSVCDCTYPQDPEYREEEDCFILTCATDTPTQYSWGDWSPFSACDRACGGGSQFRTRDCIDLFNPSQMANPSLCPGTDVDSRPCNTQSCSTTSPNDFIFTPWSACGSCSANRVGTRTRVRCDRQETINSGFCVNQFTDRESCTCL